MRAAKRRSKHGGEAAKAVPPTSFDHAQELMQGTPVGRDGSPAEAGCINASKSSGEGWHVLMYGIALDKRIPRVITKWVR